MGKKEGLFGRGTPISAAAIVFALTPAMGEREAYGGPVS